MQGETENAVKAKLRGEALARRDTLSSAQRAILSARIVEHAEPLVIRHAPKILAGYWPIRSECDPRQLLAETRRNGAEIVLPVVRPDGLLFRLWREEVPLVKDAFGTQVPPASAPERLPDVLLVPLVAFDRTGMRLGYGRGYYDRAVAALAALGQVPVLIGLAFSTQEVATLPAEPHDVRLDYVVTEAETVSFSE